MDKIIDYLVDELGHALPIAIEVSSSFERHGDIRQELETWIDNREYSQEFSVKVEGYTAKDIIKLAPFFNGVGVYNFLITLRERPEVGKRIIDENFKRK